MPHNYNFRDMNNLNERMESLIDHIYVYLGEAFGESEVKAITPDYEYLKEAFDRYKSRVDKIIEERDFFQGD
jgi:hypothetical protein